MVTNMRQSENKHQMYDTKLAVLKDSPYLDLIHNMVNMPIAKMGIMKYLAIILVIHFQIASVSEQSFIKPYICIDAKLSFWGLYL